MTESGHDYLWDRSGPVDPEVAALEQALAPLGLDSAAAAALTPPPVAPWGDELAARRGRRRRLVAVGVALTAAAAAAILWWSRRGGEHPPALAGCARTGTGFPFQASAELRCGAGRGRDGVLAVGASIETEATPAVVTLPAHGQVELAPGSRLGLRGSRPDEHRFVLERGSLAARVKAPPRLFVVETASATAVDLGCAYTLTVDDGGRGRLVVTGGKVELALPSGPTVVVAAGTSARFAVGQVGTPVADDATPELRAALDRVDAGELAAVPAVLAAARAEDLVTLANLLVRVPPAQRPAVAARLEVLVPQPERTLGAALDDPDPTAALIWRGDAIDVWMVDRDP